MVEPTTGVGLTAVALAYLGKDGVDKLLGPTASYLGEGVRDLVQSRYKAIGRIFKRASDLLGSEIENPGQVPPSTLKQIIDDGSFHADESTLMYFGGVLASSRSSISRDDRSTRICKTISNMSSYQVRGHYILYNSLIKAYSKEDLRLNDMDDRAKMGTYISMSEFTSNMDFDTDEALDEFNLCAHILHGLKDDGLLGSWIAGDKSEIQGLFPNVPEGRGIVFFPTSSGTELLLWCMGKGRRGIHFLFSDEFDTSIKDLELGLDTVQKTNSQY